MFTKTLKKYQTEIVGYFKNRYSSGFVEGINSFKAL
ncbi:transposase [Candidatus Bealeia paramacronuclearis]